MRSISADSLFLLSGAPGDPTDFAIAETRAWVVVDSMRMTVPLIVFGGAAVGGVAAGLVFVTQVIRGLGQLSNSLSCFAAGTTCPPDGGPTPAEEAALVRRVGYTAAAIGAVVGGIAGHQWHRVRWRRVRSGDWATVGVHPGGVGVQVSW
ncbi:MAG: hypothetical protein MUF00_09940 [Gemmatimonadaceae bacterium]|nr:hypothetical protein [Gemmatimonadaceae bacterium]